MTHFGEWLEERTSVDKNTLGGSRVFKGTRLSVARVGWYPVGQETELSEDYPFLTELDVRFARQYVYLRSAAWYHKERP